MSSMAHLNLPVIVGCMNVIITAQYYCRIRKLPFILIFQCYVVIVPSLAIIIRDGHCKNPTSY